MTQQETEMLLDYLDKTEQSIAHIINNNNLTNEDKIEMVKINLDNYRQAISIQAPIPIIGENIA